MYTIALHKLRCLEDTSEIDSDEPYALVFVADASRPSLDGIDPDQIPQEVLPAMAMTLYGPWDDVDTGQTVKTVVNPPHPFNVQRTPAWGVGGPVAIDSPDDLFVIVALVENDEASPGSVRTAVQAIMEAAFVGYLPAYWKGTLSRSDLAGRLIKDLRDSLNDGLVTLDIQATVIFPGFGLLPQKDDLIDVDSFRIRASDLERARLDGQRTLTRSFRGDDARYEVTMGITHHAGGSTSQALTLADDLMVTRPAIVQRDGVVLDVVGRGTTRGYHWSIVNGSGPTPWRRLGVGEFLSGPALVTFAERGGPTHLMAMGRGDDRRLYQGRSDQDWSEWRPIHEGTFLSGPALAGGALRHLAAVGDDRRMYHATSSRIGIWSGFEPVLERTFLSPPAAVVWRGQRVDLFALGDDRGVYQTWKDTPGAPSWQPWRRLCDGTFITAPAVAASSDERLHVVCVGDDRRLYELVWTPSGWSADWTPVDSVATFRSGPALTRVREDFLEAVAVGDDRSLFRARWTRGRWSGWSRFEQPGVFS